MKFFCTLSFLLLFSFFAFSKNENEIDSLKTLLEKSTHDSERAKVKLQLSDKLTSSDPSLAKQYALDALAYYQKTGNDTEQAKAMNTAASAYISSTEYEKAIDFNLKALKIFETHNSFHYIIITKNKLGIIYYRLGNYVQAMKYYEEALNSAIQQNDKLAQSRSLNNIGLICQKLEKYDSALVFYQQTLKITQEMKDSASIAGTLNNIANIYNDKHETQKAIEYWSRSLKIKQNLGDMAGMSNTLQNIGFGYFQNKEYEKALEYIYKGLEAAKKINSKEHIKEAYAKLSDVYSAIKNSDKAFEYLQLYNTMKDSIFSEESSKQIAEMQTKYETDKKEKQIEIQHLQIIAQDAELNKKQITIYASIGGLFLLLLLAVFIFRGYKQKQQANILLEGKNTLIEAQKKIVEEKNKDITDSINYARRIQEAILPAQELKRKIFPDAFVLLLPRNIVSGDFYWFTEKNGKRIIAAVDCTGHGVPGAFMSMIGNAFLNEIINEKEVTTPSEILNLLRQKTISTLKQTNEEGNNNDGMDISLLCIDEKNNTVEFSGANNSFWYIRKDAINEINGDKQPIGSFRGKSKRFTNHKIELQKGDSLYIFSDGYADQFGGPKLQGKKFKYKQLQNVLLSIQDRKMSEQEKILHDTLYKWKGNLEQVDDILVIGIKI